MAAPAASTSSSAAGDGGLDIVTLLGNTLSPDAATRSSSTSQLEQLSQTSIASYLVALAQALANPANPSHIRNSAGLAIKNSLSARVAATAALYSARWKDDSQVNDGARSTVKSAALSSLADSDARVRTVAGQIIAAVANIELPEGAWNDLIPTLLGFVGQQENTGLRQASLQAIGFVCEELVSPS